MQCPPSHLACSRADPASESRRRTVSETSCRATARALLRPLSGCVTTASSPARRRRAGKRRWRPSQVALTLEPKSGSVRTPARLAQDRAGCGRSRTEEEKGRAESLQSMKKDCRAGTTASCCSPSRSPPLPRRKAIPPTAPHRAAERLGVALLPALRLVDARARGDGPVDRVRLHREVVRQRGPRRTGTSPRRCTRRRTRLWRCARTWLNLMKRWPARRCASGCAAATWPGAVSGQVTASIDGQYLHEGARASACNSSRREVGSGS